MLFIMFFNSLNFTENILKTKHRVTNYILLSMESSCLFCFLFIENSCKLYTTQEVVWCKLVFLEHQISSCLL